ncbi:MAG TPA: hypothetical protein PLL69_07010 [Gemmatimonadales bacterium]|nr:hypothetical protein [Gemmatimonadales bacterium]
MTSPLRWLATTTPGLESLLLAELDGLGVQGERVEGGVEFGADIDHAAAVLVGLRTAHRVTLRLAEFGAKGFAELERNAAKVDWSQVVGNGAAVHFRVTSRKSRLYHQDAIAERLERAVAAAVSPATAVRSAERAAGMEPVSRLPEVQRFVVRVHRDRFIISADASGALLHQRGWRQETAKAPLRETLAAAMLFGIRWDGRVPLHDPFCGSGTILIEAAQMARRMAPGRTRRFAMENWPMCGSTPLERARKVARSAELAAVGVAINGTDRDDGAIRAAIANAERADVAADVSFARATVSETGRDDGVGLVITNPPYGVRVGERNALRDLYAVLGRTLEERRPDWGLALLSASPMLDGQLGMALAEVWRTTNGGIPVRLMATGRGSSPGAERSPA